MLEQTMADTAAVPARAHILVVDDDPVFLRLVERTLRRLHPGAHVHVHDSAVTGLAFYRATYPSIDVVILDYLIGETTGMELAMDITAINPLEKILLMSAFAPDTLFGNAGADRITYFLQKSLISPAAESDASVLGYYLKQALRLKASDLEGRMAALRLKEIEGHEALAAYVAQDLREAMDGLADSADAAGGLARLRDVVGGLEAVGLLKSPPPTTRVWMNDLVQATLQRLEPLFLSRGVRRLVDPMLVEGEGSLPVLVEVLARSLTDGMRRVAASTRPSVHLSCEHRRDAVRLWVRITPGSAPIDGAAGDGEYAVMRRALQRMGGSLGVEVSGETWSFWMELPLAAPARS